MMDRKLRTREHNIADLGVNYVERQVLLCGNVAEKIFHDYGYDLVAYTFDTNGQPEPGEIRIQVKATDKLHINVQKASISVRVSRSHIAHWLTETFPVILVVYDADRNVAYWTDVKGYFRELDGFNIFAAAKTLTIGVPPNNVFDTAAVDRLAAAKNLKVRETM